MLALLNERWEEHASVPFWKSNTFDSCCERDIKTLFFMFWKIYPKTKLQDLSKRNFWFWGRIF